MLAFFRKYQRYIYTVISVMIIISFSFFGTYGALNDRAPQDEKAFTAVDGSSVSRSEVERMSMFIGTDATDMKHYGAWGPNFFNDGVIDNDFVRTGLASILIQQYATQIKPDLDSRTSREKRYQPYQHPGFKALSATEVWRKYQPQKMDYFTALQASKDPLSQDAITARLNLYLSEREFSGQDLKQTIMFAEKMNQSWVHPDQNLPYIDLSLFGYHTADDWLGPKFVKIASAFIINAAKEAEAKGYTVPNDEVLADLIKNARISYNAVAASGRLGVSNANDYFREQLRRLHMDQNQAIHTWKQVMLFRRLFGDVGNAAITDPLSAEQFLAYAKQSISGDEYSLPAALNLGSFKDLQAFETYLKAVAPKSDDLTSLPKTFKSVKDVPGALVEQRYSVELAKIDIQQLATRVSVRATWDWEFHEANWSKIVDAFPELGVVDAKTDDQREKALDRLDPTTRARVDSFAREQILKMHSEWIAEALQQAPVEQRIISIRETGGTAPLPGVEDRKALVTFLNGAESGTVRTFTPNEKIFYSIKVIDKDSQPHILTYEQAKNLGVLEELTTKELNDYYVKMREGRPDDYKLTDGEWKELQYVRNEIAQRYMSKTLAAIQKQAGTLQPKEQQPKEWTPDLTAAVRFVKYMSDAQKALQKNPTDAAWVTEPATASEGLAAPQSLADQWKLVKASFSVDRSQGESNLSGTADSWTSIQTAPNGQIQFRHITEAGASGAESLLLHETFAAQKLLSDSAQQFYMKKLLAKLQEKNAMNIDYLQPVKE